MPIELIGKAIECSRRMTGFYSLDRAFMNHRGDLGIPVGIGWEIFGLNHVGKSTLTYGLAGMIANPGGIVLSDFEGFDPQFMTKILQTSGFDGKVNILGEVEDEDQLDGLITTLRTDEYSVGIVDSIGAISPIAEQDGDIGDANMGRRALILAQFIRKALHLLRFSTSPKTIFMVNHWYPKIGSRGYDSPGGEVKKYLASVRVLLKRREEFPDGSYILEGKVAKNRWGFGDRTFNIFVLAGIGLHKGLSAMYDGMILGKVDRKKNVKIGDQNMGFLKNIVEKAKDGDDEFFAPFIELLENSTDILDMGEDVASDDVTNEDVDDDNNHGG